MNRFVCQAARNADKYGRHRARFTPPATPEGYWDIDDPATPATSRSVGKFY